MTVRRIAFWATVAGVSLLAQAGVELAATWVPLPGVQRFVAFIHRGPSGS